MLLQNLHKAEHKVIRRIRLHSRRANELVVASGDLKHGTIKFVMLKCPLVLWILFSTYAQCNLFLNINMIQQMKFS